MENPSLFEVIAGVSSILSLIIAAITLQKVIQISNNIFTDESKNTQEVKGKKNKKIRQSIKK